MGAEAPHETSCHTTALSVVAAATAAATVAAAGPFSFVFVGQRRRKSGREGGQAILPEKYLKHQYWTDDLMIFHTVPQHYY